MTRTAPVDPLSHSVVSRVKPLFVAWTISKDSIVPAVFATGAECVKCSADLGLSVTSRLLDSIMKFLRAGRSNLAVDQSGREHSRSQEAHFPNHCLCFDAKTVTATLVSTSTISEFPWIQRGVETFDANSRMLQSTHHPEILEFQRLLPHRITIQTGKSSHVVMSSHQQPLRPLQREASRSAMTVRRQQISSRACRSANCVSKAVIGYLVQQKVPESLVSEIVRPSPEAAELLSVSAPVAAAATRVRVDPSADVVMTPTDQAQQDEDASLRKIVAQLHVNLGHPSNDALARAIRLSGGSDDAIQVAFKVPWTVCDRLTEPSPVPAASHVRWTEFGQCVALDLFMLDMASHYQVVFRVVDRIPGRFSTDSSLVGVSRLVFLSVSGSIWEVSLNHPSVNWLSKLDADFCQRPRCRRPRMLHVNVPEERGSAAHDVWWTYFRSSGTILRQNCGFVQS